MTDASSHVGTFVLHSLFVGFVHCRIVGSADKEYGYELSPVTWGILMSNIITVSIVAVGNALSLQTLSF